MGGIVSSIFGGGSGGGGTSTTVQKTEIPKWIEEPTIRNIERAEKAAIAAMTPKIDSSGTEITSPNLSRGPDPGNAHLYSECVFKSACPNLSL